MDLGLTGRRAIVLAGTHGLGRAAATALRAEGCRVVVCGRTARVEPALGAGIETLACDIADPASLDTFMDGAIALLGGVDVLVTNCGGPPPGRAAELADTQWSQAFQSVVMSVVRSTRRVVPLMAAQGRGAVVCVGSVSAHRPLPGLTLSNVLRPAIEGYAKTLAAEVSGCGIRVNCLHPGPFATRRSLDVCAAEARAAEVSLDVVLAQRTRAVPAGRLGDPAEFGRVVAFLASDAASFCTGSGYTVDGGLSVSG